MSRIKVSEYFNLDELVPRSLIINRGEKAIQVMDMRIIKAADMIRAELGESIFINNWFGGGSLDECGFRYCTTTTGAKWSQHKYGRALDLHCKSGPAAMLAVVKKLEQQFIDAQLLTTYENIAATPSWLHIDCRWTGLDKLLMVNP
jgi:hypothetical protein